MSPETKQIKEALCNCLVLIVEDDVPLANRIATLFNDFTIQRPLVANSMEQAQKMMTGSQGNFGLAVMDVMLPPTDEDFEEIQAHEKTLERVRNTIEEAGTHPFEDTDKKALFDARYERSQALKQIESLIQPDGGVALAKELRSSNPFIPILFLTAVGDEKIVQQGKSVTGERSDWLVKPVPSSMILKKCVELLSIR